MIVAEAEPKSLLVADTSEVLFLCDLCCVDASQNIALMHYNATVQISSNHRNAWVITHNRCISTCIVGSLMYVSKLQTKEQAV